MTRARVTMALPTNWVAVDTESIPESELAGRFNPLVSAFRYGDIEAPPITGMTVGLSTRPVDEFLRVDGDLAAEPIQVGQYVGLSISGEDETVVMVPKETGIGQTAVFYFTGQQDLELFGDIIANIDITHVEGPEPQ